MGSYITIIFNHILSSLSTLKNSIFRKNKYFIELRSHPKINQINAHLQRIKSNQYQPRTIIKLLQNFNNNNFDFKNIQQTNQQNNFLISNFHNDIQPIFKYLAQILLDMNNKQINIPILYSGEQKQANLSRRQIIYLLALMAFNLVPEQSYQNKKSSFNRSNNFSQIFKSSLYKTTCIIQYFKLSMKLNAFQENKQMFTIERKVQKRKLKQLINQKGQQKMNKCNILSDRCSIEQYQGQVKIDFANKFIGGGALRKGCVQEQIMFCNHPEMFVSSLLCQKMNDNQSIFFTGFRKYFKNNGYSYSTQFAGTQSYLQDQFDKQNRFIEYISAIDALDFNGSPQRQYIKQFIDRQILKAFCGFNNKFDLNIITGNWGCGAFKGNLTVKFMIQWIAASLAGKRLMYCPFGKGQEIQQCPDVLKFIQKQNIQTIYKIVIQAAKNINNQYENIFPIMQDIIKNKYIEN